MSLAGLLADDTAQAEIAGDEQHTDYRKSEGKLITDHLGGAAQAAEKRILAVGSPACQGNAINTERGDGKKHQQADVYIHDADAGRVTPEGETLGAEGYYGQRGERKHQGQERRQEKSELVHPHRHGIFLENKLQTVGQGLQ